jgi:hypothetical protein
MTVKAFASEHSLVWMEIEARAKDVAASDGVTFEAAVERVLLAEPELYRIHLYEQQLDRDTAASNAINLAAPKPAPPAQPAISGRYGTWADVEDRARELYRATRFPSYEQALAHLLKTDHDAATIADLKSRGVI